MLRELSLGSWTLQESVHEYENGGTDDYRTIKVFWDSPCDDEIPYEVESEENHNDTADMAWDAAVRRVQGYYVTADRGASTAHSKIVLNGATYRTRLQTEASGRIDAATERRRYLRSDEASYAEKVRPLRFLYVTLQNARNFDAAGDILDIWGEVRPNLALWETRWNAAHPTIPFDILRGIGNAYHISELDPLPFNIQDYLDIYMATGDFTKAGYVWRLWNDTRHDETLFLQLYQRWLLLQSLPSSG